jgi:hypothetical protein
MATTGNWNWLNKTILIFGIYMTLEEALKAFHVFDYLNLGFLIPMIEKRNTFVKAIYHTLWTPFQPLWTPLRPILNPLYWGVTLKCFVQPDFWKPGAVAVFVSDGTMSD